MKHLAIFLMLMAAPAAAQEQAQSGYWRIGIDADHPVPVDEIADADLMVMWGMADENCRGGSPNHLVSLESCGLVVAYGNILKDRNFCVYGPLVTHKWEKCRPGEPQPQ